VLAQAFPSKPIHLIVPFPPGGADSVARLIAPKMSEGLGQSIVVENRGGGNGLIGAGFVARAPADGYTILYTTPTTQVTPVYLSKNLTYDPVKDFAPITCIVEPVSVLVARASFPASSLAELLALAKRQPGKLTYSSSNGSVFHLTAELFNSVAGVNILHVPYKGTAQGLADVVAGHVDMNWGAYSSAEPQVRSGKVKLLGVAGNKRFAGIADTPTVGEAVPGFEKPASWFAFFAPAGVPQPIIARYHAETVKVLGVPDMRAKLAAGGFDIVGSSPEEFAAMIKNDFEIYGRAGKAAGLKPE
jgi:tripartite-type tricarboxylate transporter receptor subunit TctC